MSYRDYLLANMPLMRPQQQQSYAPPRAPLGNDPRVTAAVIASAIANQRKPVAPPGITYTGGGAPVHANDILGQRGPVVTGPQLRPAPTYGQPNGPVGPAYVPPSTSTGYEGTGAVPVGLADAQSEITNAAISRAMAELQRSQMTPPRQVVPPDPVEVARATGDYSTVVPTGEMPLASPEELAARDESLGGDPGGFFSSMGSDLLGGVDEGARRVVGGGMEALADVPLLGSALKYLNKPLEWNLNRAGNDAWAVANGKGGPGLSNPYFYVDSGLEVWAGKAENRERINAAYAGLDLDGDGTVDVKGGTAVYMLYSAEEKRGFINEMISQLAMDPLFLVSFIGPMAAAGREGAQVARGNAALTGATKAETILAAVDRALSGITRTGDIANKVADAPFSVPIWAAKKAGEMPGMQSIGGWVGDILGPSAATKEARTRAEAERAASQYRRAEDLPADTILSTSGGNVADNLPERVADEPMPTGTAAIEPIERVVDTELPAATAESAIPAERTAIERDVDPSLDKPIELMTREERNLAIQEGRISVLDPVPGGPRLIDKAADRATTQPVEASAFAKTYAPKAAKWQVQDGQIAAQMKVINDRLDAIRQPGGELQAAKSAQRAAIGDDFLPWDHPLMQEQKELFRQRKQFINEQVLLGIEHVVDDVAPSFAESFRELPDIAPTARPADKVQAKNKAGELVFHRTGEPVMVDAAYKDQPLPYLYQRYVYETSEKIAENTMLALRARKDLLKEPYAQETLVRLADSRRLLKELRQEYETAQMQTATVEGTAVPVTTMAVEPPPAIAKDMTDLQIQVARGELSPEVASHLEQPLRTYRVRMGKKGPVKTGGTWTTVSPQVAMDWATANKIEVPASGEFKHKLIEAGDATHEAILRETIAEMPEASSAEIANAYADKIVEMTGARVPPRIQLSRPIEAIRRPLSSIAQSGRSIALHNIVTGPRGIIQDFISDPLRMALDGNLPAALESINPVNIVHKILYYKGKITAPREIDALTNYYGMDPIHVSHKTGRSEVELRDRTPTNEMVSGAIGLKHGGSGDRAVGGITGVIDNKTIQRTRAARDDLSREAISSNYIKMREGKMVREFTERARILADQSGIQPASVNAYLAEMDTFRPADVRATMTELATDAGLSKADATRFGNKLAEDWRHRTGELRNKADAEQKRVLFSYERTKADQFLGNFIFYHYWMSRAIPGYLKIAMRNPEVAAMWVRAWNEVKERAERDGYPNSVKGFIKFMGSQEGFYGLWNPLNVILPIADLKPQIGDNMTGWDKWTQFVALSPLVQIPATVIGLDNTIADPFATYAVRNMAMAIVNKVRAETGRPPYHADAYNQLLVAGYQYANDLVGGLPVPGFQQRAFLDPAVFSQSELRSVVATVIAEQTGIPTDQWVEGDANYELWLQVVSDGEAGIENPIYQKAFERWADAKLEGRILNSIIPGGVRTRYGPRDELLVGDLTDEQRDLKTILNAGSTEDAQLDILDAQYHDIGTTYQVRLANTYNDIMSPEDIPVGHGIEIGGEWHDRDQILALDEADREVLAKQWVSEQGVHATDELSKYRDERKAFVDAHPEYGDFKDWQSTAYDYEGGLHQFRLDRAGGNPNFKWAMEERERYLRDVKGITDKTIIEAELDQWAPTMAAYKAAQGIKDYIYDPNPISTGDQSTVDTILKSIGSGGGSKGSGGSSSKKTYAEKVQADITEYETDSKLVADLLTQYGIDPILLDSHNPMVQDAIKSLVGDQIPYKSTLQKQYEMWAVIQRNNGADDSVAAFGRYMDKLEEDEAA